MAEDTSIALKEGRLVTELHPSIARAAPNLRKLSTILTYRCACNSSLACTKNFQQRSWEEQGPYDQQKTAVLLIASLKALFFETTKGILAS
jgi:hypothetical protein